VSVDVVLPRRAIPQPSPSLVEIGDCGACALGGVFGLTVPEAYARLHDRGTQPFTPTDMRCALYTARSAGLCARFVTRTPLWPVDESTCYFGATAWDQAAPWFDYVRLGLEAGCYGVTMVRLGADGPFSPDALYRPANHWALICGARERRPEGTPGCAVPIREVLVSCSAKGERWVDARVFLHDEGGFNVMLARPA
jgi:hypothetical protein